MLDVLAVLDAVLARDPGLARSVARALGMAENRARALMRWCAAAHDIGKVSREFQSKAPEVMAAFRPGERPLPGVGEPHGHDTVGFVALRELWRPTGGSLGALSSVCSASAFHHGRPRREPRFAAELAPADTARAAWLLGRLEDLLGPVDLPDLQGAVRASWLLSGLVSLADGLGSEVSDRVMERGENLLSEWVEHGFAVAVPWEEYLERVARPVAEKVVSEIGETAFCPLPPPPEVPPEEALARMAGVPIDRFSASPLQRAVAEVGLGGQFLAVVEDVTGSGKTEASALLARRAIRDGLSEGGFWGLPTQATANGLYARFRRIAPLLHGGDPSLVLAHGAKDDVPLFRRSLRNASGDPVYGGNDAELTGGATCVDWLVGGSHRALLAHCGVGTVDQVLLAALNSYHCGMRWLGLHRKVLVVDEVHAADAGMLEILRAVLRHHGQLGGSAVLMSATLASSARARLIAAFADGAGLPEGERTIDRVSYPLLTVLRRDGNLDQRTLATRDDRARASHRFRRVSSEEDALVAARAWANAGRSVIWFRNTVRDALAAAERLAVPGARTILFHSRFTRARRAKIEDEVLRVFGPESDADARRGVILVATQVAEQSLDLDADEAVLDLAPADLLLQRLGRRRRHLRCADGAPLPRGWPDGDGRPEEDVLLLAPDPREVNGPAWVSASMPGTASVYPDAAALWRSAQLLLTPSAIPGRASDLPADRVVPHRDARPLVEAVYPPESGLYGAVPEPLRRSHAAAVGEAAGRRDEAHVRVFEFRRSYLEEAQRVAAEFEDGGAMTATRDGDGGTVHLAVKRGGRLAWFEDDGMAASSVPVPHRVEASEEGERAVAEMRAEIEALRRHAVGEVADRLKREARRLEDTVRPPVVVVLRDTADGYVGTVRRARDRAEMRVLYDAFRGLRLTDPT